MLTNGKDTISVLCSLSLKAAEWMQVGGDSGCGMKVRCTCHRQKHIFEVGNHGRAPISECLFSGLFPSFNESCSSHILSLPRGFAHTHSHYYL